MKAKELALTKIGNSRGVRLPAETLRRYGIGELVIMEERPDEIVLRPKRKTTKLSWSHTFKETAAEAEDWSDLENAAADGVHYL